MMVMTRRGPLVAVRPVAALSVAACLALSGCGGSSEEPSGAQTPAGQSTAAGSMMTGRWPLTGLPARGRAPAHPVMVVKIDNSESSRPQVGLGRADLVTEELVEGGTSRLAVFYYSALPAVAGPVRSMRATDIGIVEPANAVLVASGGAPPTVRRVRAANIQAYTEGAPGFYRDNSRVAPYNLFNHLRLLARVVRPTGVPDDYLPWGNGGDFPKGVAAHGLDARFSGSHTTSWAYRGKTYVNLNSEAAVGDQFHPDTVLVLRVRVGNAGYLDPAGNPVPETHFVGKGAAMVFHGGRLVRATWSKPRLSSPVHLSTKAGELGLPPGHVWIELVPRTGGAVVVHK